MIIGSIGIALPILPTTPFLLLTLYFYSKSSEKLNNWFVNTKIYKKHLKDFYEKKEIKRKYKYILLFTTSLIMIFTFIKIDLLIPRILILFLELFKYYYFNVILKTV